LSKLGFSVGQFGQPMNPSLTLRGEEETVERRARLKPCPSSRVAYPGFRLSTQLESLCRFDSSRSNASNLILFPRVLFKAINKLLGPVQTSLRD
jgi:hypothetical protein